MRLLLALTLASALPLAAQQIIFKPVAPEVVEQRFARLQPKNADRADSLRAIFTEAGCTSENWTEQKIKRSKLPNLICTLPGSSDRRVVVSAHYDKVDAGQGAIDNWSGASLLPSLYESLREAPRTLTYVFLLTTDEEKGLIGAQEYVRLLTKAQLPSIVAQVNLDSLGLAGPTYAWHSRADKNLWNAAVLVSNALKLPLSGMNIDGAGESDSLPFTTKHIPVIDFHSLNRETIKILHTPKDVPAAHDPASYYDSFRLLTAFLAYLDVMPEPLAPRK
jgi:acetylornithine deacetylase/succinyl-diaminopimelate desuccinylase-like protein